MKVRKNILIVCEGESSEPSYFEKFRDEVYKRYRTLNRINDINIRIDPVPPLEKISNEKFSLREGAKRRTTSTNLVNNIDLVVEDDYKSQPICYVRKAQILGLENGAFSDVWAVYDKDEHPKHKEALQLASRRVNDSYVNIGFTSVAFEYWILLHFELCTTPFQKSMCRAKNHKRKKIYFFCGSKTHSKDCNGESCICGRIVASGYLKYLNNRKNFDFNEYYPKVKTAMANALSLNRTYKNSEKDFYNENPYSNLYRLVFKLLHLPKDFLWFDFKQGFTKNNNIKYLPKFSNDCFELEISNNSNKMYVHNSGFLLLIDLDGNQFEILERKFIEPFITERIIIPDFDQILYPFIGIKDFDELIYITEIIG